MARPMSPQTKRFNFREDGRFWIIKNGFYYVDSFGWCHSDGYAAIIEFCPQYRKPWVVTTYKSAVPPRPHKESAA